MRDIRTFKRARRENIKEMRRALSPQQKAQMDARVRANLLRLHQYQGAGTVLLYMSTPIEVDTRGIIEHALGCGKRVALPRCVEGTRLMNFYLISSCGELEKGTFGVLEPKASCQKLEDFSGSICVVPGLSYDRHGYRLGYGGGYYDRFLSGYPGPKVGIIYAANICGRLPHGRYDAPVDVVVSDQGFFYARREAPRGREAAGPAQGGARHGRT